MAEPTTIKRHILRKQKFHDFFHDLTFLQNSITFSGLPELCKCKSWVGEDQEKGWRDRVKEALSHRDPNIQDCEMWLNFQYWTHFLLVDAPCPKLRATECILRNKVYVCLPFMPPCYRWNKCPTTALWLWMREEKRRASKREEMGGERLVKGRREKRRDW